MDINNIFPNSGVISRDDIYTTWINVCNFSLPLKELFRKLPIIWQDFIETQNPKELENFCNKLLSMKHDNGNNIDFLPMELRQNASDCFVIIGQYDHALEFFPSPIIGNRSTLMTDNLLSLKLVNNKRLSSHEVLTLLGAKVTNFGREHLQSVLSEIDRILEVLWDTTKIDYIAEWAKESPKHTYYAGNATPYGYYLQKHVRISGYTFSSNPEVSVFISNITREAENSIRENFGIPKVGEGWVGETLLYYKIKEAFSSLEIQQHASPKWLGRQHLDIFIPSILVGIEYQGDQHDKPVDFFGGEEAFIQNQKRDNRKLRLCKKHGVHLIYVRPGYAIQDVVTEIESISQSANFR